MPVNRSKFTGRKEPMRDTSSLCHSRWYCKYHIVWILKYRRKAMFGNICKYLGETFHDRAHQKESQILERHVAVDHVHIKVAPFVKTKNQLILSSIVLQFLIT
jgi:REP element-mobilizing transposase RayT